MTIVAILEFGDGSANVFHVFEDAAVDRLFLQGPVETFGHAIGLWLGNEGETRSDTPEFDLVEEVVRRVLRPVIHSQCKSASGIGAGRAEFGLQALCNRLQGGKAIARLHHVDADTAGVEMIDSREHPDARSTSTTSKPVSGSFIPEQRYIKPCLR